MQKIFTIYYFSGTGNSKNTALWIADKANEKGIICKLFNIAIIDRLNIPIPEKNETIIFISPTHGFNFPLIMLNFLLQFPKANNKTVIMNTRAAMKIGNWVSPGLSGITLYFAAAILKLKGYKIQASYSIDLPSNWISIHPGLRDNAVHFINEKIKCKVNHLAGEIINEKRNYYTACEVVLDLIVAPLAFGYYFVGRFMLSKTYYASKDCDNCGLCIKNCPVNAIKYIDNRPFWTYHCESCMKCMSYCPKEAIETAHGFIIGVTFLILSVIIGFIYGQLGEYSAKIQNSFLSTIIESAIFLLLLFLFYRVFHYLLRLKYFERLMVYTSLTKFKFWGKRYRAPKS
jgi:ferredoxin